MSWYHENPKKIEDGVANIAIGRYKGARTSREENPRAFVMGLAIAGPIFKKNYGDDYAFFQENASGPEIFGVRFYRAIMLRKRSDGNGGMVDIEFEVLIGVGVDKQMRDVPGTYFTTSKVEWK